MRESLRTPLNPEGNEVLIPTEFFVKRASIKITSIVRNLPPPGRNGRSFFGQTAPSFDFAGGMIRANFSFEEPWFELRRANTCIWYGSFGLLMGRSSKKLSRKIDNGNVSVGKMPAARWPQSLTCSTFMVPM